MPVLCLASPRDPNSVTGGQGELRRPVHLETLSMLDRRADPFADHQPRSPGMALGILLELNQIPRLILRSVRFLRLRQVRGNPRIDRAFLTQFALRLQIVTDGVGDALVFSVRRADN